MALEIVIKRIVETSKEVAIVEFSCAYGKGKGVWEGDIAVEGRSYDVELEIDDELVWGRDVDTMPKAEPFIRMAGDSNVLGGRIETIDKDDIVAFRFGEAIVMLECKGKPLAKEDEYVSIVVGNIRLFETNI